MPTRRIALAALALAALAACEDDAPPLANADAGHGEDVLTDIDPADFDPPCPRTSEAPYVRTHNVITQAPVFWDREAVAACITLSEDPRGTEDLPDALEHDALVDAIARWQQAADACPRPAPLCLQLGGAVSTEQGLGYSSEGPNFNLVTYIDDADTWATLNNPRALAATTITQVVRTGRIVDADLTLNDAAYTFSLDTPAPEGTYDLATILTHEIGHLLGFDHTTDTTSIMFPSEDNGADDVRRDLNPDDVAGVCEAFACY